MQRGFTLVELSIVLVIIGLIVGGVLVGRDLIKAAETRSQIAQVEKYMTAANTFRNKYNGIPGDIAFTQASSFGFNVTGCDGSLGSRDGSGLLAGGGNPIRQGFESTEFWQDLSFAQLIDGTFPNNGGTLGGCQAMANMSLAAGNTFIGNYYPLGKIGGNNYLYLFPWNSQNWMGLFAYQQTDGNSYMGGATTLTPLQANDIDSKVDDGNPVAGRVRAEYTNGCCSPYNVNGQGTDSTTSCYNTGNNTYSISSLSNYGTNQTCALAFKVQ